MNKYDNMLQMNKRISEEKVYLALNTIRKMKKNDEHITIVDLTRLTGLSRSFFYKNAMVNAELKEALRAQRGRDLSSYRDKTLNDALKETIRIQKQEIENLRRKRDQLIFTIKRMKQEQQDKIDLAVIDKL